MKIVICSINPLFGDKVIGGSTKHLRRVAEYLAEAGHEVAILCTRRDSSQDKIEWHPNIKVRAVFPFKQPFPMPYDIPAFQMGRIIQLIIDECADADRLYMHDGEILFPPLSHHLPTVVSLRDCVYAETMLGSFLFQGDAIITLNEYCKNTLLATAGSFLLDLPERVRVIPNGFDFNFFKPTPPSAELLNILGIDPQKHTIVLHPHRPELSKGLLQTVRTVEQLVHKYHFHNLKVLIPKWFDADQSPDLLKFLQQIKADIHNRGLDDYFHFHNWLPQRLMPEYFSLGHVTLVLGHFVEAFGNSAYESLACGTPAVVSRVSSNRDLVPDELLPKVHFNDIDSAARLAADVLNTGRRTPDATMEYIKSEYGVQKQCMAYAETILNAEKRPPMRYRLEPTEVSARYVIAPWCYIWGDHIYHDHLAVHVQNQKLVGMIKVFPEGVTTDKMISAGATPVDLHEWLANGYLVRAYQ